VRFGPREALAHVQLSVAPGEVVALLGPNGAGKSTCVETLLGYRRPDGGRAEVLGRDPVGEHRHLVTRVGAMLQRPGLWPSLTPIATLRLIASYYVAPEDPDALVALLDLGPCARTPNRRLSGGELQRLSVAVALLPRPDALFLDEPTAGVDPIGRRVIRDVVLGARSRGAAVLLCTHDLDDVEAVCDSVVILHAGRVLATGTVPALTVGGTTFRSAPGLDPRALASVVDTSVEEIDPGVYRSDVVLDAAMTAALAAFLASGGHGLEELHHGTTLERRYVALVGAASLEAEAQPAAPSRRHRR
jgi:ABC-2 type transport system ATP-binding protein